MTTTLNIASLRRVQAKIDERLAKIKDDVFESEEHNFKRYVGEKKGLEDALFFCEQVETEFNS